MIGPINLSEIAELAPMPASIGRLCTMMNQPDTTIAEISRLVELDQALTANTLKMANSAWSSAKSPIATVRQAVIRLGTARILGLALAQNIANKFKSPFEGYNLAEHELWRHSVAAALAAEIMNEFTNRHIPGVAFTGALLHDIGKLILARHIDKQMLEKIHQMMSEDNATYLEAERALLKTDHAVVGGEIARHWQFPEQLVYAIEKHHDIDLNADPVYDAVHIANAIAKLIGEGLGSEQMNMRVSSEAHKRLGLNRTKVELICAKVQKELNYAESLYRS